MMMVLVEVLAVVLPFAAFLALARWLLGSERLRWRRITDRASLVFSAVELVGTALMGLSLAVPVLYFLRPPAVACFCAALIWLIYASRTAR
jgi:hypothetical protein